jgi:hypothetical protein
MENILVKILTTDGQGTQASWPMRSCTSRPVPSKD